MANEKRLIDANALCAEIINAQKSLETNNDAMWRINQKYYKGLAWAHRLVLDAPTVDAVEVVHGRWEDMYGWHYVNQRFRCSVCNEKALYKFARDMLGNYKEVQEFTPCCPYCGAKMDGDGNG